MSLLNQSIIKHKMGLLNLAEELHNVSQACRVMGVSRDTFYRVKEARESGGLDALLHKDRRRANLRNRVEEAVEAAILAFAIENPAAGQVRVSNELRKIGNSCQPDRRSFSLVAQQPADLSAAAGRAREEIRRRRTGADRTTGRGAGAQT
jgi:hypothetical protein